METDPMIDDADREIQALLKRALDADAVPDLDHDLWPRMRARLDAPRVSFSLWDGLLAAAVVVVGVAFPNIILSVLYHL
jgi:hypothetical protein